MKGAKICDNWKNTHCKCDKSVKHDVLNNKYSYCLPKLKSRLTYTILVILLTNLQSDDFLQNLTCGEIRNECPYNNMTPTEPMQILPMHFLYV